MSTVIDTPLLPGVSIDAATFLDITPSGLSTALVPDGKLRLTFADTLTESQVRRVRIRCMASDADHEALLLEAVDALPDNLAYLASVPSSVRVTEQVAALTRQVNALIELVTRP